MSARMMAIPAGPQSPGGENNRWKPRSNQSAQADVLGAPAADESLNGLDDSARFVEELLRRYEVPYPLPWRHGGLNEYAARRSTAGLRCAEVINAPS